MTAVRRGSEGSQWLAQLETNTGPAEPSVVRGASGGAFVIDGEQRRAVSSGLLAAALEQRFGAARVVSPEELQRWTPGPPVEVLEGPKGSPFVVVTGKRLPVRGLPVPYPVAADAMERFPEGPAIDIAGANIARARYDNAVSGKYHIERLRAVYAREGPVKGTASLARRAAQRVRSLF
jgi:hypothetical protein